MSKWFNVGKVPQNLMGKHDIQEQPPTLWLRIGDDHNVCGRFGPRPPMGMNGWSVSQRIARLDSAWNRLLADWASGRTRMAFVLRVLRYRARMMRQIESQGTSVPEQDYR